MTDVTTTLEGEFRHHPLGSSLGLVWWTILRIDDPTLPALVDLELDESDEGRLVIKRMGVGQRPDGPPVTIEVLKSMPLVRLVANIASGGVLSGLVRLKPAGADFLLEPADGTDLDQLPELEAVAVVYRAAYFVGLSPTATVAEVLSLSRDVAAKRVQAARRAGLLDPTKKGRKGA